MHAFKFSVIILLSIMITANAQHYSTYKQPALILSPLIKQGLIEKARNVSQVDPQHFLNITSHSGFITVNEDYNSNLFFWYFPHEKQSETRPWIIWLQGGPGASSMYGVFDEMGPFSYSISDNKLQLRDSAWTKDYSMLFIDNPVGAGYSFTENDAGAADGMTTYSAHLYTALQQFVTMFPVLRKAPLYIAGESYAGYYVPAFATEIMERSPSGIDTINLQGLMMGNPVLEREDIANYSQLFYQWGLIDSQGLQAVKPLQDAHMAAIRRNDPQAAYRTRHAVLDKLYDISAQKQNYNILEDELSLTEFQFYLTKPEILVALHVITEESQKSDLGNRLKIKVVAKLIPDFLTHMRPIVEKLLEHYRVMIYCGQLDVQAACVPSAEGRRRWIWSGRTDFLSAPRVPWTFGNVIAGYVKSGGRLTEVLVRGAGHLVPMDKGAEARQMVSLFIEDAPFPQDPQFTEQSVHPLELKNEVNATGSTDVKSVMIASMVLNLFLGCVVVGVVVYYRFKFRRYGNYIYNSYTDSVLSLPV